MAETETIATGMAGRYALALFELAQDQRATDRVAQDLADFLDLIRQSPDLARFVRSPVFTADEQVKALGDILARAGFSPLTGNFLKLVAAKRRLFAIETMVKDFTALSDNASGRVRARVTVAEEISPEQRADLERTLSDMSGGKQVAMDIVVDRSIIGGMIVKLGSRMIDGSVRTKLNTLRTRMKEVG